MDIECARTGQSLATQITNQPPTHQTTSPTTKTPYPKKNSSLPPFRGEARWGVGRHARLPTALLCPNPLPHHFCLRRNDGEGAGMTGVGMRGVAAGARRG